jgi:hypothetical protein
MRSDSSPDLAEDRDDGPSLWQDLVQGRAGVGVRMVLGIIALIIYVGLALIGSYFLAAIVPRWGRAYYNAYGYPRSVRPREELIATLVILGVVCWIATMLWLFLSHARRRASFTPVLRTLGVSIVSVITCVIAGDSLRGDSELVIAGVIMLAVGVITLIWLQAVRRGNRGRPLRNRQDQLPDLRCPECGYRMVGLTESRCPECGTGYTLDELVARQGFARQSTTAPASTVPPPPPPPNSTVQPV